jgi:hypothetical protein
MGSSKRNPALARGPSLFRIPVAVLVLPAPDGGFHSPPRSAESQAEKHPRYGAGRSDVSDVSVRIDLSDAPFVGRSRSFSTELFQPPDA